MGWFDQISELRASTWGLGFVRKLTSIKWRYKPPRDDGLEHFGFPAQQVAKLAPPDKYGFVTIVDGEYQLNMYEFIGPLQKSIENLDEMWDIVAPVIRRLEEKVSELEARLDEKDKGDKNGGSTTV